MTEEKKKPWFYDLNYREAFTHKHREQGEWDEYFMDIAERTSRMSKCRGYKNGAVIVKDKRIISHGYNGSPPGSSLCDSDEYCPRRKAGFGSGEGREFCPSIHAETNAILNSRNQDELQGATLYLFGLAICCNCAKQIATVGISRIMTLRRPPYDAMTEVILRQAEITVDYVSDDYHRRFGIEPFYFEKVEKPPLGDVIDVSTEEGLNRLREGWSITREQIEKLSEDAKERLVVERVLYPPKFRVDSCGTRCPHHMIFGKL